MRTLVSLLATAALVGGVHSGSNQVTTTKKGAKAAPKKPAPKGSGSSSEPSGPGAGGASPPGR